jgi:hypothetical protein
VSEDLAHARPDWTNRRRVVSCSLLHAAGLAWASLAAAVALAWTERFGGLIATMLLTTFAIVAAFAAIVIGSYVFGAAWEGSRFMQLLTELRPAPAKGE